jgi:hypothetical protein
MINLLPALPHSLATRDLNRAAMRRNRTWCIGWYVLYVVCITAIALLTNAIA